MDDEETWQGEGEWTNDGEEVEGDVKDESAAYLEFLNEEVRSMLLQETLMLIRTIRRRNSERSAMLTMTISRKRVC